MSTSRNLDGIGEIKIHRRKGAKNLRIRIDVFDTVHLTLPKYVPLAAGLIFINQHKSWILSHRAKNKAIEINDSVVFNDKYSIQIEYKDVSYISASYQDKVARFVVPNWLKYDKEKLQKKLRSKLVKQVKETTSTIVIPLLYVYAERYSYALSGHKVKTLRSRWGSCSNDKVVTLNSFLSQLPDELIEYVLLHELVHTKHMHHQNSFWAELGHVCPDYKIRRKQLKNHQPKLNIRLSY